ncbi:MAG TPA: ADYC domain-containing protein, partial [Myxococcus sp.]|nr:ADYC domain-containing protein [Myxococcus sp.]
MRRIVAALTGLALAACSPSTEEEATASPQPEFESSTEALTTQNGGSLNGGSLNGGSLNGGSLNGGSLNGNNLSGFVVSVDYALAAVNGSSDLDWVALEGTTFHAQKGAVVYSGYDFINAWFYGNLGDGRRAKLRVAAMRQAAAPNADLTEYFVEYMDDSGIWYPFCRDAANTPVWAYPVKGVYDYRSGVPTGGAHFDDAAHFTFACAGGAINKCVNLGYRPWAQKEGVSLAPYHQACTRLIRADYCGDGTSYTQNGNRVNLYDPLGIQQDTEHWFFEANWDESGATCFSPLNRSRAGIPCYNDRLDLFCGVQVTEPNLGILLQNETPTAGLTP